MSQQANPSKAKEAAAMAAVEYISDGMTVGLGTGSTAAFFVAHLGEKVRQGLKVECVSTSQNTSRQACHEGIPLLDINAVTEIDVAVDGADEVDSKMRLIKGGGGAALREKIVASMSKEFIVIVDSSKVVDHLGRFPLPLEVSPFGYRATIAHLEKKGYSGHTRVSDTGDIFVTDNGNYIIDVALPYPCKTPEKDDSIFRDIPGVLETGFFLGIATQVLVGRSDGHVETLG